MCIYTQVELQRKLCRVVEDQVEKILVSEVDFWIYAWVSTAWNVGASAS